MIDRFADTIDQVVERRIQMELETLRSDLESKMEAKFDGIIDRLKRQKQKSELKLAHIIDQLEDMKKSIRISKEVELPNLYVDGAKIPDPYTNKLQHDLVVEYGEGRTLYDLSIMYGKSYTYIKDVFDEYDVVLRVEDRGK